MPRNVTPFKIENSKRKKYKQFKKSGVLTNRQTKMLGEWILNPKTRLIGNAEIAQHIGESTTSMWRTIKKGGEAPLNEFTLRELEIILKLYNEDIVKRVESKPDGSIEQMTTEEKRRLSEIQKN